MNGNDVCSRCYGAGYYALAVPMGHPQWGKPQPCPCQASARAERRAARLQRASSFTPQMERMTFTAFTRSRQPEAFAALQAFARNPQGWVYLGGSHGTGKTHLLSATYQTLRAAGRYPLYVYSPDLLDFLREGMHAPGASGDAYQRLTLVRECAVLLLDDLGAESETDWAAEQLQKLLDYRYRAEAPTVIASNLDPMDYPLRLASRLADTALVQHVYALGDDYRPERGDHTERTAPRERR